jgi:hypothetical protein
MTSPYRSLCALSLMAIATCAGDSRAPLIMLDLDVPAEIARRAEARSAGDAAAPTPVLRLEDVELGAGERLSLELRDPDAARDDETGIFGQAATVGSGDGAYAPPVLPTTLVIPLNDNGCRFLAGKQHVRLALRVESDGARPPLRIARLRFETNGE